MASMRVHELAKEFDMTSKELLDRLHEMKIPAKSHASMLADAYVDKIRKNLSPEIKQRAGKMMQRKQSSLPRRSTRKGAERPRKRPAAALPSRRARASRSRALAARAAPLRAMLAPSSYAYAKKAPVSSGFEGLAKQIEV